jgi:hypothetical protein
MKHLGIRNWNKDNRSERLKSILEALNRFGTAEAEYFKGRFYLSRLLLGRGHPISVHEDDNWNYVKIAYQSKNTVEIFDSYYGPNGHFFDENFTEHEVREIEDAFADAEVAIQKVYLSRVLWIRALLIFLTLGWFSFGYIDLISGSSVLQVLFRFFIVLLLLILLSRA